MAKNNLKKLPAELLQALDPDDDADPVEIERQVTEFLDSGGDVNAVDPEKWSLLMYTANAGIPGLIRQLIHLGADIHHCNKYGNQAVIAAAYQEDPECLKLMLAAGADCNAADKEGLTPLMNAAQSGRPENIKILIQAGAKINAARKDGCTALMDSSENGKLDCVKILLGMGADWTAAEKYSKFKWTALHLAVNRDHGDVVRALIDAGADPNSIDGNYKGPAIIPGADSGKSSAVKALIEAGAGVNVLDQHKYTPLLRASLNGYADTVEILLAAGADPGYSVDGQDALQMAVEGEEENEGAYDSNLRDFKKTIALLKKALKQSGK